MAHLWGLTDCCGRARLLVVREEAPWGGGSRWCGHRGREVGGGTHSAWPSGLRSPALPLALVVSAGEGRSLPISLSRRLPTGLSMVDFAPVTGCVAKVDHGCGACVAGPFPCGRSSNRTRLHRIWLFTESSPMGWFRRLESREWGPCCPDSGIAEWAPRRLNRVTPSALMGCHRPVGSVSQRRTSVQFQRCRMRCQFTSRNTRLS